MEISYQTGFRSMCPYTIFMFALDQNQGMTP